MWAGVIVVMHVSVCPCVTILSPTVATTVPIPGFHLEGGEGGGGGALGSPPPREFPKINSYWDRNNNK